MVKRLRLNHEYHDAIVSGVRYAGSSDLTLDLRLFPRGNSTPVAFLTFIGVRNLDEVRAALDAAGARNQRHSRVDGIIGIVRHPTRGFILDLETAGAVHVDAGRLRES